MNKDTIKAVLLDHFKHPRNKVSGPFEGADIVKRGSNPQCGDEIEIGLFAEGDRLEQVKFRGRGCSICLASASIMTEAVSGKTKIDAIDLCTSTRETISGRREKGCLHQGEFPDLDVLMAYTNRKKCSLLSWEALADALESL